MSKKNSQSSLAEHFDWKSHPFLDGTPDPFVTAHEQKCLDYALSLLKQGKSFTVTGSSGAGKTTFVQHLLKKLDPNQFLTLFLPYGGLVRNGLLRSLADTLRLDIKRAVPTHTRIHQHLVTMAQSPQSPFPVLVVDDAQHLEPQSLQDLCSLLNNPVQSKNNAALILIGDETLTKKINLTTLAAVSSRMVCNFKLAPLSEKETFEFMRFRLDRAEAKLDLFQKEAVLLLYSRCRGNRRVILNTAANLCLEAMSQDEKTISADLALSSILCDFAG